MRLYYRVGTGRPLRVAWELEELGVAYEPVALSGEECVAAEHLERHPLGRVPALELDDGATLFESTAIVLAVADMYPEAGLIGPLGSPLRAQVYGWSIMAMTELESAAVNARFVPDVSDVYRAGQRRRFGAAASSLDVLAVANHAGVLDGAPAAGGSQPPSLFNRSTYRSMPLSAKSSSPTGGLVGNTAPDERDRRVFAVQRHEHDAPVASRWPVGSTAATGSRMISSVTRSSTSGGRLRPASSVPSRSRLTSCAIGSSWVSIGSSGVRSPRPRTTGGSRWLATDDRNPMPSSIRSPAAARRATANARSAATSAARASGSSAAPTTDRFGRLDVLVNNAGFGSVGAVEEIEDGPFRALMETMFFGALALGADRRAGRVRDRVRRRPDAALAAAGRGQRGNHRADAIDAIRAAQDGRRADLEAWEHVSRSTAA